MFRVFTLSALLVCSLLAFGQTPATPTTGQDPQPPNAPAALGKRNRQKAQKPLKKMDTNGDQKIERSEWQGQAENFDVLDADKDGFLTRREFGQALKDRGQQALKHFDANSDGKIAREEWTRNAKAFDRLDANGDGFLTPDELRQTKGRRNRQS
jgi:Ca2+-binding EF-hand superfamily protein